MRVLVINPGAVSTKIAAFDEKQQLFSQTVAHAAAQLAEFAHIMEQVPFRERCILDALDAAALPLSSFDAVCGRGGLLRHIESGVYEVNERALADASQSVYGEHAANLGVVLAAKLAGAAGCKAYFADPVSVDELGELARISGLEGVQRQSFFHALNQKSSARMAAAQLEKPYEELTLIVAHLGGGVSVAAHEHGRVVDVFNVRDDGAMGMDRAGSLPVNAVVELCYSGKTKAQVKKLLGSEAGVYSYLGTKSFREVEERATQSEDKAMLIFRALAYQLAKDIGAMAAVLHGRVDAIVLTGGIAYSQRFCDELEGYVRAFAPVLRLPGETEMQALADAALLAAHGQPVKEY